METSPASPADASTELIGSVLRSVARDGTSHVVALERDFPHPPESLWHACTSTAGLSRWFEPIDGELVEGGRYRLTDSGTSGTIERCEPGRELRVTWEYDGDVSLVALHLEPSGQAGTRLTLRHTVPDNEHWSQFGPAASGIGWEESLHALSIALDDPDVSVHAAIGAFNDSDEGRAFVDQAAERWCGAHLSAGADPDDTHAAAARTAAFYRGDVAGLD